MNPTENDGITITRSTLNEWAGFALTDSEIEALANSIPWSSIPEAIGAIAANFRDEREES